MTLIIAFLLGVCLPLQTSLGKKPPKPPPEPPPPPPVLYDIQFFELPGTQYPPAIYGMNNSGSLVGFWTVESNVNHGFVYDPNTDIDYAVDLNDIEYDPDYDSIPPGWEITWANDINDLGGITAWLERVGGGGSPESERLACFINMNADLPKPQLILIDPMGPVNITIAVRINNSGDIVGSYQSDADGTWRAFLYNPGGYDDEYGFPIDPYGPVDLGLALEIVGTGWEFLHINDRFMNTVQIASNYEMSSPFGYPYRWTIDVSTDNPQIVEQEILVNGIDGWVNVAGINYDGVVLGSTNTPAGKNGKQTVRAPYKWYDAATSAEVFTSDDGNALGLARSINDDGDFITTLRVFLEDPLDDPWDRGYFYPDELIDAVNDPDDAAIWFTSDSYYLFQTNNGIDKRFGQIAGRLYTDYPSGVGFVLWPDR